MSIKLRFCSRCGERLDDASQESCSRCGHVIVPGEQDPHFFTFYRTYHFRALILCALALPVGIILKLPVVWGLALLGVAVTSCRLRNLNKRKTVK